MKIKKDFKILRQMTKSLLMLGLIINIMGLSAFPVYASSEINSAASLTSDEIDWSDPSLVPAVSWPTVEQVKEKSKSFIVIDRLTGAVILANNEQTAQFPASTTKILTALLALENLSLSQTVTASENAVKLDWDASKAGFLAGETTTVRDALAGLMFPSGNDAAIMLAEAISGSVEAFAERMNVRAAELGATVTHMVNANGLHDDTHQMSTSDLAKITAAAMRYPAFRELVETPVYAMSATNLHPQNGWAIYGNTNIKMLLQNQSNFRSSTLTKVTGVKTGTTNAAGQCLVTAATTIAGQELICVLFGVDPEDVGGNAVSYSRTLLEAAAIAPTTAEQKTLIDVQQTIEVPGTHWIAQPSRSILMIKGILDFPEFLMVWPAAAGIQADAFGELQIQSQGETLLIVPVQFKTKPTPIEQLIGGTHNGTNATENGAPMQSIFDWHGWTPLLILLGILAILVVVFNVGLIIGRRQGYQALARRMKQK